MQQTQSTYPVFEANQVLTNAHLNQVFNYLNEQERLTRANLIGIGIVCGLEITRNTGNTSLHLSKGCGITSDGYLIVQPDTDFVGYREYKLPGSVGYTNLVNPLASPPSPYLLWELFPAGNPNVTSLGTPVNFLDDKAVLLFLELNNEALRNCSPNNCDDKGAQVTATVRCLLIRTADLNNIIALSNQFQAGLTAADMETMLLAKLHLPDLRLPRYDVDNTSPATSKDVLAAFRNIFRRGQLAVNLGNALKAAYEAFKPIVDEQGNTNPFNSFTSHFKFLETAPTAKVQVLFLQYFVDFFDDLLNAYEEFRSKGIELLCACCPPERLFPRHLMLGNLGSGPDIYRQHFIPSSAVSGCDERDKELKLLFRRMVEMVARFTDRPTLPDPGKDINLDAQIRITPSKLSEAWLADKAIPYYYLQTGATPLYQLWNARKTRLNKANQNLSYRSDEYTPAAPAFITDALSYDLQPYNFLRIEGHLGKNYQSVLSTLLQAKAQYRLPIDVIALRTGAFDETISADLSKEEARFQDLETLYDAFREDLLRNLTEGVIYLYNTAIPNNADPGGIPQLALLKNDAPAYRYTAGTVGAWYEKNLALLQAKAYIDVDQNNIDANAVLITYCILFGGTVAPPAEYYAHVVSAYYLTKLSEIAPQSLGLLVFADFQNKYQDLVSLTRYFRSIEKNKVLTQLKDFIPSDELLDYFNEVLFGCRLDAIRSIHDEYLRRIRQVKQKQFFSSFLLDNPGIQHKAGVPLGGTFILVYHDDPRLLSVKPERLNQVLSIRQEQQSASVVSLRASALADAVKSLQSKKTLLADADVRIILGELTGQVLVSGRSLSTDEPVRAIEKIFNDAIDELTDGTIIADFFLPYMCSSTGASVQFVLPRVPPTFTVQVTCTNANGEAATTLTPAGGLAPYSVKIDDQNYQPIVGSLLLKAGTRSLMIKDAEGTESASQTINIPAPLVLNQPVYKCTDGRNEYTAEFDITGGTPPYTASSGTISNTSKYVSGPLPGDTVTSITITDSTQCKADIQVNHSCLPPLVFTVQIGCTDKNSIASVNILPAGGKAPYILQTDGGHATPLTVPLMLAVGTHKIAVSDSAGTTQTKTIAVLPALTIKEESFSCDKKGRYSSTVRIEGGMPPYTMNGVAITANPFVAGPFDSSTKTKIVVNDVNACSDTIEVTHTCPEPCNLPCDGIAMRCGYRFWLPDQDANKPFLGSYQAQVTEFNIEFPLGSTISLKNEVNAIIQTTTDALIKNYDSVVLDWISKINQLIAKQTGSSEWLKLSYTRTAGIPFGVLWIEHYKCLLFTFRIQSNFKRVDFGEGLNLIYAPAGTTVLNSGTLPSTSIPAFNCIEIDKCDPKRPETALCRDVKVPVKIIQEFKDSLTIILKADTSGTTAALTYVWEVEDGSPPASNKKEDVFVLKNRNTPKQIRLSVFTEKGCITVIEDKIGIEKP